MKTKNGISVTQFDADYTERAGYIKFDFLSLDAIDRLQSAFDLLLRDKKIEWQGSLKETYDKYFSPNKLDFASPKMYDMLFNGDVINAFEFSSGTGNKNIKENERQIIYGFNISEFIDEVNRWRHERNAFGSLYSLS